MNNYRKQFAVVSIAALAAVALAYQATVTTLYQDGKIVSSSLKTVDGQLYLPVKDLNAYLGGMLKTSDERADITTMPVPQPNTSTGGQPQTIATDVMPQIAQPASPFTTTGTAPPPPPPTQLTSNLNGDISYGDFVYRVKSIDSQDRTYREQFDQRGQKLHPQWKTDKLVIVYLTVTNNGSQAATPSIPGGSDITIFDDQKVGYPATDVDIRQISSVQGDDSDTSMIDGGSPISILGPGGSLTYAVIGSIPKDSSARMIRFHISPYTGTWMSQSTQSTATPTTPNPSGADVVVNLG